MRVERYSHGFMVSDFPRGLLQHIDHFLNDLTLRDYQPATNWRPAITTVLKRFYALSEDGNHLWFHINHYEKFMRLVYSYSIQKRLIDITDRREYTPTAVAHKVRSKFTPRDHQIPIIDFICSEKKSIGVYLYTGGGKTAASLMACAQLGHRLMIMIPPKYFGLWTEALQDVYENDFNRYMTVSGGNELKQLTEQAVLGELDTNVILVSNVTYRSYIESYIRFGHEITDMGYGCTPVDFHEYAGIGVQIHDEIQDDPGLVFRMDMFTHIPKQIYLSATPYTGSNMVTKMIGVMLPVENEAPVPKQDVYIEAIAVLYSDDEVKPQDYNVPGKRMYNHSRYEKKLLAHARRKNRYFKMVSKIVNSLYVKTREPGQKMLILCSTINFIEHLVEYLCEQFPHLRIEKYAQGISYDVLLEADISISTIKSAGQAVDIPNVREVLLLQATDSKKDNIQVLGRLRRLKGWPDVTPRLTYVVCENINKHMNYHRNKKNHLRTRVINHRIVRF